MVSIIRLATPDERWGRRSWQQSNKLAARCKGSGEDIPGTLLLASLSAMEKPTTRVERRVETACLPTPVGRVYCPGPGNPALVLAPRSLKRSAPFRVLFAECARCRLPSMLYADGPAHVHEALGCC